MQTRFSLIMLFMGLVLLWPVPLGGALLLVTASIGLAIAVESDMAPARGSELGVELVEVDRPAA
jgi:hypothetical protein